MRLNHFLIAFTLVALSACSGQAPQGIQVDKSKNTTPDITGNSSSSGGGYTNQFSNQETLFRQNQLDHARRQEALQLRNQEAKQRLKGTLFTGGLQALSNCIGGTCNFRNVFQTMIQGIIGANLFGGGAGGANTAFGGPAPGVNRP